MRVLIRIVVALLVLLVVAAVAIVWGLRRSVPPARESLHVAGLEHEVTIAIDSLGVPTIRAASIPDLAFGQGYVHARDRRFQMELIRRSASGRLAEVFGPVALDFDRESRRLGFAAQAESVLTRIGPERRALYSAYAAGVNAWDRAHPAPPEFSVLRIPREPWRVEDYALVLASMNRDLQLEGENERMVATMDAALPRKVVDFLTPDVTDFDVVMVPGPMPTAPATPGPDVFDARGGAATTHAHRPGIAPERDLGSNAWAIAPSRTRSGRAILSGDPHLGIRVPVIWQRQRIEGPGIAISGCTLPGSPGVVIGASDGVAWSFTNLEGDLIDFVRVRAADPESLTYAGPEGPEPFRMRREIIGVKGRAPDTLEVRVTRWGPVLDRAEEGGWLAIQWGALDPDVGDFDFARIDAATDVASLFAAMDDYRGPNFNLVAADSAGHIGWRSVGRLPRRHGFDPRRPRDGAQANAGWNGFVLQDSMPRVVDPAAGLIASANQRPVGGVDWQRMGSGTAMPWRARRIHDVIAARTDWDAAASAGLQNDLDDALLGPTAEALDRALTPEAIAGDSTLAAARRLLDGWTHRADTTSAAHAYLRYARTAVHELLLEPFVAPCRKVDPDFAYAWPLEDEVTRRLLEERPAHLLDPRFTDYDALVRAAADSAATRLKRRFPGRPLEKITWGMVNRARYRHPIGSAVPALAKWLNMPEAALAGGSSVVRMTRPGSGASMRMVVEFGGDRWFSLPGGQSGHFLSPNYSDEFADWVAGRYRQLDPGAAKGEIRLTPR